MVSSIGQVLSSVLDERLIREWGLYSDVEVASGILYYMETSSVSRVRSLRHEIRHLLIQRNALACHLRDRLQPLPPMLNDRAHTCKKCYARVSCFVYQKLGSAGEHMGQELNPQLKEDFDAVVGHLTPKHQTFFRHWDELLTREEADVFKYRRELWTMLSEERERLGRCFSNVIIQPGSIVEDVDAPKIYRYQYSFIKPTPETLVFSFMESQLTVGEPIVVSDEQGHFALANGYVTEVHKHKITVSVDRRLRNTRIRQAGFDEVLNQTFTGIMEVNRATRVEDVESVVESPTLYRIDKDEFTNGMATVRNNLVQIMADDGIECRKIRHLVVDCKPPSFAEKKKRFFPSVSGTADPSWSPNPTVNDDQRQAIEKVLSAQDYALVQGMPGTGKTTTIAQIIRALVAQGKTVLLASYTHAAVDNILLKIRDLAEVREGEAGGILRLGAIAKIHPEVQQFAKLANVTARSSSMSVSVDDIRKAYHDPAIVATTCLGIGHAIFSERVFDYCIVDEASQITLPVCLGPIRMAGRFVLVGDHKQLPPLVRNEVARRAGLDISLFKILSDMHPSAVVRLAYQYRMCKEIMSLSNTLIYDGVLRCGSDAVANRSLYVPDLEGGLLRFHRDGGGGCRYYSGDKTETVQTCRTQPSLALANTMVEPRLERGSKNSSSWSSSSLKPCWLAQVLDPSVKVCFINTDTLLPFSYEEARGARIVNPAEAKICQQLVMALLTLGVSGVNIGIITPYRSQLALLKQTLHHHHHHHQKKWRGGHEDVEMDTTDKFQGRDKEVVVLSLVRSNESHRVGDLLKDWRRINVAFTRARSKLLIVGSQATIAGAYAAAATGNITTPPTIKNNTTIDVSGGSGRDRPINGDDDGNLLLLREFVRYVQEKQWCLDLPVDAITTHPFLTSNSSQQQQEEESGRMVVDESTTAVAVVPGDDEAVQVEVDNDYRHHHHPQPQPQPQPSTAPLDISYPSSGGTGNDNNVSDHQPSDRSRPGKRSRGEAILSVMYDDDDDDDDDDIASMSKENTSPKGKENVWPSQLSRRLQGEGEEEHEQLLQQQSSSSSSASSRIRRRLSPMKVMPRERTVKKTKCLSSPPKKGRVTQRVILGGGAGRLTCSRPVLRDIINDAS